MSETTIDKLMAAELCHEEEYDSSSQENYKKENGWQLDYLNIQEQKILSMLRSKKYETVKIHFKNEAIAGLELISEEDVQNKIVDLLSANSYQDIIIKTHQGHITRIQRTVKIKVD